MTIKNGITGALVLSFVATAAEAAINPSAGMSRCGEVVSETTLLFVPLQTSTGTVMRSIGRVTVRMDFKQGAVCYFFTGDRGIEFFPGQPVCLRVGDNSFQNPMPVHAVLPGGQQATVATIYPRVVRAAYRNNWLRCHLGGDGFSLD